MPGPRSRPWRRSLAVLTALLCALGASGCLSVTLYQPQKAIHRPVVVERSPANFAGMRILVRCLSHEDWLPPEDASQLCGRLAEDLARQGAETEWVVPVGARWVQPEVFEGERPDLTIEIESKIDHEHSYRGSLVVSIMTLTVLPSVSEQTFSQRVVVLGRDRSVLTEELFRERFVEYHGVGVWSLNWVLDWLFRPEEQAISGDAGKEDFSRDFYGQIRQLAFNARIRSEVLGLTEPPTPAEIKAAREAAGFGEPSAPGGAGAPGEAEGAGEPPEDGPEPAPAELPAATPEEGGDTPEPSEGG